MFKLSSEASLDGVVTVENKFIVEYLPYADGDYVKVYIYGLSLAARKEDSDDTLDRLARRLDLDRATVDAAVDYFCDQGLMSRLGDDITYLSVRGARPKIKKYDVDKYREFNRQCQLYISARQITPNEYNDYYALMEKLNIEWQAMVLIVKYCVDLKGGNVSAPYILAVARNLEREGYRSYDEVENRLEEYGVYYNDLCAVLSAMGGKKPDHESVGLYKKWLKTYKFDKDVILHAAGSVKKGGAAALDRKLESYFELGLMTAEKIDGYEEERRKTYKLAKAVNKALGVYYENVDPEIATYIRPWLDLGFDGDAIISAADYCMKSGLKTLSDLDAVIREFFSGGISTADAIDKKVSHDARFDTDIAEVMTAIGERGAVKSSHRAFYANWAEKWNMEKPVILYAAGLSVGKPFGYINSILSAWHAAGINSVAAAETAASATPQIKTQPGTVAEKISAEDLNALFTRVTGDDNE